MPFDVDADNQFGISAKNCTFSIYPVTFWGGHAQRHSIKSGLFNPCGFTRAHLGWYLHAFFYSRKFQLLLAINSVSWES